MDILAHMLWANAGARKVNTVLEEKKIPTIHIWWAAFWGIFPDLFAFGAPMIVSIVAFLTGQITFGGISHHGVSGGFDLASSLYNYSHSLVIFVAVFLIVWAYYRRPRWELLGWALHILIDIPTHSVTFFPTPFLWPISNYHFPYGFSWRENWFMVINYIALLSIFIPILWKRVVNR
jgi:hypothetical protein